MKLILIEDFTVDGWECGSCLYTSKNQHKAGCPECTGNTKQTDLIEEIIKLTLKNGGTVNIVEDEAADELEKHEHRR